MKLKLFEYDILDNFFVPLPNEDFNIKWQGLSGPYKCMKQIVATKKMFEIETEHFQLQQISDIALFHEKFEGLNMNVGLLSAQCDVTKTTEISIDIKKLWKTITETMDFGKLLNKRQLLFGLNEIDLSPINQLQNIFEPYKLLWITAADFIKCKEAWLGNPLSNNVVETIRTTVNEFKEAILNCIDLFAEIPQIQNVAKHFHESILAFEPILDVMGWLKNPAWILYHWHELEQLTGLEIKFSLTISLAYCIAKGIMKYSEQVRQISEAATRNKDELQAKMDEEERLKQEAAEELIARNNRRRGRKLL